MSQSIASTPDYIATIRKVGNEFIAYDQDGNWRTRGPVAGYTGKSPLELAQWLFHADEIANAKIDANGDVTVEVYVW